MRPGGGGRKGRKLGGRVPTAPFADTVMVVHGPEAFDEGDVARLLAMLSPRETVVAGVMARTAAEESALPVTFDGRPPSRVIGEIPGPGGNPGSEGAGVVPGGGGGAKRLLLSRGDRGPSGLGRVPSGRSWDRPGGKGAPLDRIRGRVFLVNRGKTPASGRIFGEIVASRLPAGDPLVQVECYSGIVYLWNGNDPARDFARLLAGRTGFVLEEMKVGMVAGGAERKIRGCIPGEAVLVEGIVIGTATAETVVLEQGPGGIEPVSGLAPKAHGLEKLARLGAVDLPRAWCKSGSLRRRSPRRGGFAPAAGRIAVIDHCGHDLYRSLTPDTCGVLAIGDDTTAVCGHICLHRGIPVFGVVDGDLDGLVVGDFPPGSVIAEVLDGTDDEAGHELAALVRDVPVTWSDWVARALASLKGRCRIIHPPSPGREGSRRDRR